MGMKAEHVVGLEAAHRHNVFDNSLSPILTVAPGTTVQFECPGPPVARAATVDVFSQLDPQHPHTIVGPIAVAGAEPGDVLEIDIVSVEPVWSYGHCYIFPGMGLLGA